MSMDRDEMLNGVRRLIGTAAINRLKAHARVDNLTDEQIGEQKDVMGHWMALILIAGRAFKLTFKVFYMSETAVSLAARAFDKEAKDVTLDQAHDFVKEFCNLTGARVKRFFEDQELPAGISLPLVTRGFDDLFSPTADGRNTFSDKWRIRHDDQTLTCAYFLEFFDSKIIDKINFANAEVAPTEEGEVDFL